MTNLITEDMMVPSEPGIDIFVRNKRPTNLAKYTAERTLLFVHGSTYPAHTGFDIPLGGQSWMEYIASRSLQEAMDTDGPMPPSEALIFSLAAGLAVQSAVAATFPGLCLDLKWPNDLLLNGRKFCGILTEMNSEATRVRHLVVGVGINVNQTKFPAELREIATSLKSETGTEWSRVELCAALLKSLDREYRERAANQGQTPLLARHHAYPSSPRFFRPSFSCRSRSASLATA